MTAARVSTSCTALALGLVLGAMLVSVPGHTQTGPRALFPPAPPPAPALPERAPPVGIAVQQLRAPTSAALGDEAAAQALGGPLWRETTPAGLRELIGQLPEEPAVLPLRRLQRLLLMAPGPLDASPDLLAERVRKLIAMGEAAAAADLVALASGPAAGPSLAALRTEALLAAGRTDEVCAAQRNGAGAATEAELTLVCAALEGDEARLEAGLAVLAERGATLEPSLQTVIEAMARGDRAVIESPPPATPLLVALARQAPLDVPPEVARRAPAALRRALAANPHLASAARAAASADEPPVPSDAPGLTGAPPADWGLALAEVPADRQALWAALVDGLGHAIDPAAWEAMADRRGAGDLPDLRWWQGLAQAREAGARGATLLYTLLLLDGRPTAQAPVTVREGLRALRELGLAPEAAALAQATAAQAGF